MVYESHFLPQEETTPDELLHFVQRAFSSAQERDDDYRKHYGSHVDW